MPPRKPPPPTAPAKPEASLHLNLLWVQAPEALLDQLLGDPTLRSRLVARPAPDLAAFPRKEQAKVVLRLQKLGQVPELIGGWL